MDARHEHDCSKCKFLGQFKEYDLYFCPTEPTLIARYGPDGEYRSGLSFGIHYKDDPEHSLGEAYRRAVKNEFIK